MANYHLTFRIADKTVGGKSYADRRQQLIDNVYSDNGFWDEPTSFILVHSGLNTPDFAKLASKGLSPADDLVLVFDPEDQSASCFGKVEHFDVLRSFLPNVKKLP